MEKTHDADLRRLTSRSLHVKREVFDLESRCFRSAHRQRKTAETSRYSIQLSLAEFILAAPAIIAANRTDLNSDISQVAGRDPVSENSVFRQPARRVPPYPGGKVTLGRIRRTAVILLIQMFVNRGTDMDVRQWPQPYRKSRRRVRAPKHHMRWYEGKVGPATPQSYEFPFGKARHYDAKRPMQTLKTAWRNVLRKAKVKIRLHDLRHTVITKLAESGASDETIMAIAGHVSRRMLSRYAHIRTEAKRRALEAVATSHRISKPVLENHGNKNGHNLEVQPN